MGRISSPSFPFLRIFYSYFKYAVFLLLLRILIIIIFFLKVFFSFFDYLFQECYFLLLSLNLYLSYCGIFQYKVIFEILFIFKRKALSIWKFCVYVCVFHSRTVVRWVSFVGNTQIPVSWVLFSRIFQLP